MIKSNKLDPVSGCFFLDFLTNPNLKLFSFYNIRLCILTTAPFVAKTPLLWYYEPYKSFRCQIYGLKWKRDSVSLSTFLI